MVHQVKAPRPGHLFHPKLWVLRYVDDEGDERFRLVCGSRNLTHDRAWDAAISLDGRRTLQPHKLNRPLADLLASLPARVSAGVPADERRELPNSPMPSGTSSGSGRTTPSTTTTGSRSMSSAADIGRDRTWRGTAASSSLRSSTTSALSRRGLTEQGIVYSSREPKNSMLSAPGGVSGSLTMAIFGCSTRTRRSPIPNRRRPACAGRSPVSTPRSSSSSATGRRTLHRLREHNRRRLGRQR